MKPRFPIDTGDKVAKAREYLGLTKAALARVLRVGGESGKGYQTISHIEEGRRKVPGPMQVALELMVQDKGKAS